MWQSAPVKRILQWYIPQGYTSQPAVAPAHGERPFRKVTMVRLRVHKLMAERKITAYALSRGADLPYPTAYRLSRSGGKFGRLHADTLDRLCRFFDVQPGRLLEWTRSKG